MRITDDQVEQVREASHIEDVVGETVQLRKRGRNLVGLCPFHKEKTPSFSVLEDRGIFKCFGCGKGGDVFGFVMELEKLSFPEAVERLARRANITLAQTNDPDEIKEQSERESTYVAARATAGWYYRALRGPGGVHAMSYVTERALSQETLKKFGVGYAPEEAGALLNALHSEGISLESLERAGVIAKGTHGAPYERFRGRLIFPIFSATGRIIGFGGRVLPGSNAIASQAKYINSPETEIYSKSRVLYGLFQAKDAIRQSGKAYLVEGYADVLAVSQAGVQNVVAASGTSLTTEQLEVLKRYAKSVVLLFDADQAGKNAAMRGIELALEAGFDVNVVILAAGEDPDSFIRTRGNEAFIDALNQEQSFIETKAQLYEEQGMLSDPTKMSVAIHSIVESIAKIPDGIKQELFIKRLASRFHLLESTLLAELQRVLRKQSAPRKRPQFDSLSEKSSEENAAVQNVSIPTIPPPAEAELILLRAVLANADEVVKVVDRLQFDVGLLTDPTINSLVGRILELTESGGRPETSALIGEFRNDLRAHELLIGAISEELQPSANWSKTEEKGGTGPGQMAEDAIRAISLNGISLKIARLQSELDPEKSEASTPILQEISKLSRLREELKNDSVVEQP